MVKTRYLLWDNWKRSENFAFKNKIEKNLRNKNVIAVSPHEVTVQRKETSKRLFIKQHGLASSFLSNIIYHRILLVLRRFKTPITFKTAARQK